MRLIDAIELVENILEWQKMLSDNKSKDFLTQVIHCINAKRTVFNLQKLIHEINYEQRLNYEYLPKEDIMDAVIYNGALDDVIHKAKMATNSDYWDKFTWETQDKEPGLNEKEIMNANQKNKDITAFLNGTLAIKINNVQEYKEFIKIISQQSRYMQISLTYDPNLPFFYAKEGFVIANNCMENLLKYTDITEYKDFDKFSESQKAPSPFAALRTDIEKQINCLRKDVSADNKETRLIYKAKIQAFGQVLDCIKEQEVKLGIVEPESTDEELDEQINSISDNTEEPDLE